MIACGVTQEANDLRQYQPMVEATAVALAAVGLTDPIGIVLADAGYWSEANATAEGPDRLIATLKDHEQRRAVRELGPQTRFSFRASLDTLTACFRIGNVAVTTAGRRRSGRGGSVPGALPVDLHQALSGAVPGQHVAPAQRRTLEPGQQRSVGVEQAQVLGQPGDVARTVHQTFVRMAANGAGGIGDDQGAAGCLGFVRHERAALLDGWQDQQVGAP